MSLNKIIIEKREQILNVAKKYGAQSVRVFGSVARGDEDENSDIDFLVRLDSSNLRGMRYFGVLEEIREELETILGRSVDIVDESGLQDPLPEHVLKEAVSL